MTHRGPFQPLPFCDFVIYQGAYSHQAREVKNYFWPLVLLSSGVVTDHFVLRQSQLLPAHPNASSHSQHSTSLSSKVTHAVFTSILSPGACQALGIKHCQNVALGVTATSICSTWRAMKFQLLFSLLCGFI